MLYLQKIILCYKLIQAVLGSLKIHSEKLGVSIKKICRLEILINRYGMLLCEM
jgi:hypothetical protein